jgi:epoxide hydrolase-like predicted phosphatase
MIKAIIFDCFGVLTTDNWKEFVSSLPESQRAEARNLNRAFGAGVLNKQDFFHEILALTGEEPHDTDLLLENEAVKNTELLKFIATLRPKYKIGLLSNVASNWIRDQFLSVEEKKLFDDFVFSYEVGMTKPDPRIFKLAAERLNVEPSEAVLVDDIDYYCAAARDIGLRTVVYKDLKQTKADLKKLLG